MTKLDFDYLPDDCDALKAEVAALEARVREMQAERGEAIAAAVRAEREACEGCADDILRTSPADGTDHAQGRLAAAWAIREKIRQRVAQ